MVALFSFLGDKPGSDDTAEAYPKRHSTVGGCPKKPGWHRQPAQMPPDRRSSVTVRWSRSSLGDPSIEDRQFLEELRRLGYEVADARHRDAAGWWSWDLQALGALSLLFGSGE